MFQVTTSTGQQYTGGSERLARQFFDAAKRSGRGAVIAKDHVVIAECDVFSK